MTMEKYINKESSSRGLWYEKNFREYLKERKILPKEILNLSETIRKKGEKRCIGETCLECVDLNVDDRVLMGIKNMEESDIYSISFKVSINDKKFFLKIEKGYVDTDGGYEEMQNTILANDLIESLKKKNVRVVNPLLGYTDKRNRSYYIAEWEALPILDNVLTNYEKKGLDDKVTNIRNRIKNIRAILEDYREVVPPNMFYDEKKDQIILFDLHL